MLDQRRRRWADVVWMLYKCFVFTGRSLGHTSEIQNDVFMHRGLIKNKTQFFILHII